MADDHYNQRIMVNAIICADLHKTVKRMGLLLLVLSVIGLSTVSANELKSLRKYKLLILASWKMQYLTNIAFTMFIDNIAIGNKVCNKSGHYFCSYQINTISKNLAKKEWDALYRIISGNITFFTFYYNGYSDMYFGCPSRTRLT